MSRAQVGNVDDPPSLTPPITFLGMISLPSQGIAGGQEEGGEVPLQDFDEYDFPIDDIEPGQGDLDGELDEGENSNGMMPPPTFTFDGIAFADGSTRVPPDTVGDVGPNHYVQMVNVAFAVYDKTTGDVLYPPTPIRELFPNDPEGCSLIIGDPIVLYDQFEDRWILTVLSGSDQCWLLQLYCHLNNSRSNRFVLSVQGQGATRSKWCSNNSASRLSQVCRMGRLSLHFDYARFWRGHTEVE